MELQIPLDKAEVLRYLGYRQKMELTPELSELIDAAMDEVERVSRPRYLYQAFDFRLHEGGNGGEPAVELLGSGLILRGHKIFSHLKRAKKVLLLAGTLGIEIERQIRLYEVSELTRARVLDACCVELIEKVLDLAEIEAAADFPELRLNRRFSPGYGDLPLVPTQAEFLATLEATKKLGITLTDTQLMLPRKSVTAICGLFSDEKDARPRRQPPSNLTLALAQAAQLNVEKVK